MPWSPAESPIAKLVSLTWQREPQMERTLSEIGPDAKICDLGAGGRRVRPSAVCVDIAPGPNVDVTADVHALPFEDSTFGLVISTGMLGLCLEPPRVLAECRRVLEPGGLLHLEVPMFQPYLPEPEDYWRWTLPGLRAMCRRAGFEELRAGPIIGPVSALANGAAYLTSHVFSGPGLGKKLVRGASHAVFGAMKYLDAFIPKDALESVPFAYGLYYVGRRPTQANNIVSLDRSA
jgi:SAM-dependent methyltransferase